MRVLIVTAALFASFAFSETNAPARVWTAKDGKQVTASLSHCTKGVVVLFDGSKKYEIREAALSDNDREYLKSFGFDPYYGLSENRVKEVLAQEKERAEMEARFNAGVAAAAAARKAEVDAVVSKLMSHISNNPAQGKIGTIQTGMAHLDQILSEDAALITYKWGLTGQVSTRQVLLAGVKTSGLADDMDIPLPGKYVIDGTFSFDTAAGAKRTVLVMRRATP